MSTPTHAEMRHLRAVLAESGFRDLALDVDAYIAAAEQTERELDSWHAEMKEAFGEAWPSDMIDTAAIKRLRRERDELKAKVHAVLREHGEVLRRLVAHFAENGVGPEDRAACEAAAKALAEVLK